MGGNIRFVESSDEAKQGAVRPRDPNRWSSIASGSWQLQIKSAIGHMNGFKDPNRNVGQAVKEKRLEAKLRTLIALRKL